MQDDNASTAPVPRRASRSRWSGPGGKDQTPIVTGVLITAEMVKARTRALGADLVGIASAKALNAFPPIPDGRKRQTASRRTSKA